MNGVFFVKKRKRAEMTQAQASRYTGVPMRTMQKWENAKITPPRNIALMYSRVLELRVKFKYCFDCIHSSSEKWFCDQNCYEKSCLYRDEVTPEQMKELRKQLNLTQKEAAKYMLMPLNTLRNHEQGINTPPQYVAKMYMYFLKNYTPDKPHFYCVYRRRSCTGCNYADNENNIDCAGNKFE